MMVLSPDTLTYGAVPELDPGPEWPSLLVDFAGPARDGELCVKWAKEAKTAADLVNELRRALYFAEAIPKGPALVSVPFDLLMSPVPIDARPVIAACATSERPEAGWVRRLDAMYPGDPSIAVTLPRCCESQYRLNSRPYKPGAVSSR